MKKRKSAAGQIGSTMEKHMCTHINLTKIMSGKQTEYKSRKPSLESLNHSRSITACHTEVIYIQHGAEVVLVKLTQVDGSGPWSFKVFPQP